MTTSVNNDPLAYISVDVLGDSLVIEQGDNQIVALNRAVPKLIAAMQQHIPAPPDSADMRLRIMEKTIATLEEHQSDMLERVNIANRRLGSVEAFTDVLKMALGKLND